MQNSKILLFLILFLTAGVSLLLVFSSQNNRVLANESVQVGEEVSVDISFTSPEKIVSQDFTVKVTGPADLVSVKCLPVTSSYSLIDSNATGCSLANFAGGSTGEVVARATIKATGVGDIKVTGVGELTNLAGDSVPDAKFTEVVYSVVDNTTVVSPTDAASCFGSPQIYQKSPYEYKVNEVMHQGDWVTFPINPQCRNKQVLESIFGPLDEINGGKVLITKPNQEFQYGFTFNRIVAIDGYNTDEILAGQPGQPGLTEQQLHDLHLAGKDTQSIENCDYNAAQMVFDLVNNVAKPNMADYKPVATGYYQFDITPKFKCDGNHPNQPSLGAGFVRVTDKTTPAVEVVCKSLTGIAYTNGCDLTDPNNSNVCYFSLTDQSIPKDFVGKVDLTCEGKSKGKDINSISFKFMKDNQLVGSQEWVQASTVVPTECSDTEKADGYKCAVGSATFDISGQGTYSASSKVCIVEGDTKTCSP